MHTKCNSSEKKGSSIIARKWEYDKECSKHSRFGLNQNFLKERFNWDQYVVWAAVKDSLLFNKKKKQLMGGVGCVLNRFQWNQGGNNHRLIITFLIEKVEHGISLMYAC